MGGSQTGRERESFVKEEMFFARGSHGVLKRGRGRKRVKKAEMQRREIELQDV